MVDASTLLLGYQDQTMAAALALEGIEREHRFIAPALLISETGNVIHRKAPDAFGPTPEDRLEAHEDLLRDLEFRTMGHAERRECAHLVQRTGLTWYDAEYLTLAVLSDAPLITEDGGLRAAARDVLGRDRVFTVQEAFDALMRGTPAADAPPSFYE